MSWESVNATSGLVMSLPPAKGWFFTTDDTFVSLVRLLMLLQYHINNSKYRPTPSPSPMLKLVKKEVCLQCALDMQVFYGFIPAHIFFHFCVFLSSVAICVPCARHTGQLKSNRQVMTQSQRRQGKLSGQRRWTAHLAHLWIKFFFFTRGFTHSGGTGCRRNACILVAAEPKLA